MDTYSGAAKGDDQWLTETMGEGLVAPFSLPLDRSAWITLLPAN